LQAPRFRRLLIALVVAGQTGTIGSAAAVAQQSVRAVEAVNPVTGDRQRYVVRDPNESEIRTVQKALRSEGYVGIGWTGRLDEGTAAGLSRFQAKRGLVECGCISYETIVALGIRPEIVATVSAAPGESGVPGEGATTASGLHSGVLYPVGIPVYVPRPPPCAPDSCEEGGREEPGGGEAPGDGVDQESEGSWIVIGAPASGSGAAGTGSLATPPGIRPSPPPAARSPSTGSPN
jgi:hypothetical protein